MTTFLRTATGKEQALVNFYAQLARDGLTVSALAEKARVGRAALTEIFNGRRTGKNTWKHVRPLLNPQALSLLKQCSAWNKEAERAEAWLDYQRKHTSELKTDFGTVRFSTLLP
jgi:hypothetical protein